MKKPEDAQKIKTIEKRIERLDDCDYKDINYLTEKIRKDYEIIMNREKIEDYIKEVEEYSRNYEKRVYEIFGRKSKIN